MILLKRYVLSKFLKVYLLTLLCLIGIFLIVDFFEQIDEFVKKSSPWTDMLAYYIYKIPFINFFIAPQAVLLATVITLASFSRNNEFIAMRACGIGVTGITMPIILASVMISILVLACNEYIAPTTNERMNYILDSKVRGRLPKEMKIRDKIWFRSANGSIWNIGYYDPRRSMMKKVSIYMYKGSRMVKERIDASAVFWNGRQWEFMDGYIRTFDDDGLGTTEYFKKRFFTVPETPDDFKRVRKRPEEMSLAEMYLAIKIQATEGQDTTKKWVDLHYKISYPFISIVLALIGIPLSLRTSRTGGLLFCVGLSLGIGFLFSFLYALGISLGHSGTFSPLMAAWGANLLFGAMGFYLVLTLDSDRILPI